MKNNLLKSTKYVVIALFISISCTSFGMEPVGDWFAQQEELARYEERIERILKNEPSQRDAELSAMLFAAVATEDVGAVKILLRFGVDVDARDNHGFTALALAALIGSTSIVELLLKHHANIEAIDNFERTPLSEAVYGGNSEKVVDLLLERGANVNARDRDGATALMLTNNPAIVRALIKAGADVTATDLDGQNAMERAMEYRLEAVSREGINKFDATIHLLQEAMQRKQRGKSTSVEK